MKIVVFSFFILYLFAILITSTTQSFSSQQYQNQINWLQKKLNENFWMENQNFTFLQKFAHVKGLYKSTIHINFISKHNSLFSTVMRNRPVDDSNMFVTSFVLYSLFQTAQLQTIKLDHHEISLALEAISNFRDKNSQFGIPQYIFWPQTKINGTWVAQPINLLQIAKMIPDHPSLIIKKILKVIGLDFVLALKSLLSAFSIPSDNDDSSVNLALLGIMKQTNSSHFQYFNNLNFNKKQYYRKMLKYAYRPFSQNFKQNHQANQIDPRVYYIYHEFLQSKKSQAIYKTQIPNIILPTTWILNSQQQVENAVKMPFSNNNVDSTVCANVLFGICYQVVTNQFDLKQLPQLQILLRDTSDLLVYSIQNQIQVRPDLTLIYYPSKYDFYWFVARLVHMLKRYENLPESIQKLKQKLTAVMKAKGTQNLLKKYKKQSDSQIYWTQFLGNYANKQRNQDAIFSTSLALNALIDTWSIRTQNKMQYDKDIPKQVIVAVESGIKYLMNKISPKMKQQNTFFSGSWKSDQTNPYIYPANVHHDKKGNLVSYMSGNNIDPNNGTFNDISFGMTYVMKGFIEKPEYQQMLKQKWFGQSTPRQFLGYNQNPFPFWSAEPITQVMLINVLSKHLRIQQGEAQIKQTKQQIAQQNK